MGIMDLHNLLHVFVVFKLIIASLSGDFALFHDKNFISKMNKVDSVGYEDSGSIFEDVLEYLHEDLLTNMGVKG